MDYACALQKFVMENRQRIANGQAPLTDWPQAVRFELTMSSHTKEAFLDALRDIVKRLEDHPGGHCHGQHLDAAGYICGYSFDYSLDRSVDNRLDA